MRTPRVVPVHAAGTIWVTLVDLDVQVVISSVTVLQPHQETHVRRQPHGVWIALNLTPHTATQSSHALYCLAPNSGRMAVCVCVCCVCVCARARARAHLARCIDVPRVCWCDRSMREAWLRWRTTHRHRPAAPSSTPTHNRPTSRDRATTNAGVRT